jgi:hypothetical protein
MSEQTYLISVKYDYDNRQFWLNEQEGHETIKFLCARLRHNLGVSES